MQPVATIHTIYVGLATDADTRAVQSIEPFRGIARQRLKCPKCEPITENTA